MVVRRVVTAWRREWETVICPPTWMYSTSRCRSSNTTILNSDLYRERDRPMSTQSGNQTVHGVGDRQMSTQSGIQTVHVVGD